MASTSENLRNYINILDKILLEAKKDLDLEVSDETSKAKGKPETKPKDEPKDVSPVLKGEKKPNTNIDDLLVKPADPEKIVASLHFRIWNKSVPIPKHMQRSFKNGVGKLTDRNPELSKDEAEAILLVLQRLQDKIKTEY